MLPVLAAVNCCAPGRSGGSRVRIDVSGRARADRDCRLTSSPAAGAFGPAGARRGAVPAQPRGARPARARPAPRSSTTCSRRRPSTRSAAARTCCASSRSTTPPSAWSRSSSRRRRAGWCWRSSGSRSPRARRRWRCLLAASGQPPGAGSGSVVGRARRRVDLSRLAVPRGLRAVLHADSGGGKARREVDRSTSASIGSATPSAADLVRLALVLAPVAPGPGDPGAGHRLFGGGADRGQPPESRLHPDARTQPLEPRRRARPRRRRGLHHADARCCGR